MKLLLPLILALVGIAAGIGAGLMFRPDAGDSARTDPVCTPAEGPETAEAVPPSGSDADKDSSHEYVKLNNQFVVPVVADDRVQSMVVLSLSVEITAGQAEVVFAREPKLRDVFLQELFDHANRGGFDGTFTNSQNLGALRQALFERARKILGPTVTDILITEIARQDS